MNEVVTMSQSILQCSISVIVVGRLWAGGKKPVPGPVEDEPCLLSSSGIGVTSSPSPSQQQEALPTFPGPPPHLQGAVSRVTNDPTSSPTTVSSGLVSVSVKFGLRSLSAGD